MSIFSKQQHPKITPLFDDGHLQEMEDELHVNITALKAGREEDALFLESLRGNWSIEQFVAVAQQRGKSWRFLSAMADQANELQGVNMLEFVAESSQQAFTLATAQKTMLALEKLQNFAAEYMDRTHTYDDPIINQVLADAREHLLNLSREAPLRLNRRLNKMLDEM